MKVGLFICLEKVDLAYLLVGVIETDKQRCYHATNAKLPVSEGDDNDNDTETGHISWRDFT